MRGKKYFGVVPNVYSKYKHYTKEGRASVVNGLGEYDRSRYMPKDVFGEAREVWTIQGTNKAYYNYR
ncbi:hypothetical protein GXN76_13365 [Kroppenstedtia pulmonis]|uniref:Uncharacterized protein n=1 Tax=Kroppenstedtia pulmonis TaxID=1380685 RepID=A0A7D3XKL9_9BACL|nr:lactococcin 972 family bacteriocin [Kroppenstedtia pulmonis]QKG86064.1 hypothetical protein GXN76_13365 [Kroppenstedtia pulmonis]